MYKMIENAQLPIEKTCEVFDVSRQAFYNWRQREPNQKQDEIALGMISEITLQFSKYGYRRVTHEMHRRGMIINHKRAYRIMKEHKLLVRKKKFKPITTQSGHGLRLYPNLAKDLQVCKLNQLWVADITYIYLPNEFAYLAAILDIFSRKCIGWSMSKNIDALLALQALDMAIATRKQLGFAELVHHSDRGVQYASHEYVKRLNEHDIKISMTESGNPRENAFAESFMKTLKVEEVYINEYRTFNEAYTNIKQFIESVYNEKRLHSRIGYKPPIEFENEVLNIQIS